MCVIYVCMSYNIIPRNSVAIISFMMRVYGNKHLFSTWIIFNYLTSFEFSEIIQC